MGVLYIFGSLPIFYTITMAIISYINVAFVPKNSETKKTIKSYKLNKFTALTDENVEIKHIDYESQIQISSPKPNIEHLLISSNFFKNSLS